MKRKTELLVFFIFTIIISTSCVFMGPSIKGNGNVVEEIRNVQDFEEIKVSRGMNVYISQGKTPKVLVKADENLLEVIETKVNGNTLTITSTQNIRKAKTKKVYVTVEDISYIKSTAGSNVFSETVLESKNLCLACSAGSNIKLEVDAEDINVSATAGSNIKLEGVTTNFQSKATSGSNIKAEGLLSKNCNAKVSSGANIWLSVKDDLEAHASSGGNVFYYGNPETTNAEKSSGGNIIKN